MMQTHYTLRWIEDPGHAWLEVPMALLSRARCKSEFSKFSYYDHGRALAYLEEDCDASIFLMRAEQAGLVIEQRIDYVNRTHVRGLPSYPNTEQAAFRAAWDEVRDWTPAAVAAGGAA